MGHGCRIPQSLQRHKRNDIDKTKSCNKAKQDEATFTTRSLNMALNYIVASLRFFCTFLVNLMLLNHLFDDLICNTVKFA